MRTRAKLIGVVLIAWLLVALVAPCAALADAMPEPNQIPPQTTLVDVIPDPRQVPLPPTTQTAATTTGTGPDYAARPALGHRTSPDQNFVWCLLESMVFVGPLLLTLIIEVPIVAIAGKGSAASWKVGVLVNTLTNPVAVATVLLLAAPALKTEGWVAPLLLVAGVEIAVVAVEWRVFRWALGWSNRRALVTSLVANALSFGIGVFVLSGGRVF